ncbi:MAG: exosome nuclease subunit [Claussenomyces sp. TS43310]|nr:MAG: exosome nuclease subunit [Claussenomyces sp. TS43310]
MDHPQDYKSMQDRIQEALVATTRTAGQISAEDLGFQRSLNPAVSAALDEHGSRLLALASDLLKSSTSISELKPPSLQDVDDVDNSWRGIVDVVDSLLEKADTCLDEYTGVIKRRNSPNPDQVHSLYLSKDVSANASIQDFLFKTEEEPAALLGKASGSRTNGRFRYQHPYETEILQLKYPAAVYQKAEPISYPPIENTTATFVDTYEGVLEMLEELKSAPEIAVDLEHHDARSYVGLVSLMQISTRDKDWIIDTLKPWREELQVLNEVFANPDIIKVFIAKARKLKHTHFLLYIFDHLRNELIERSDTTSAEENRLEIVLQKSKETSLLRYERQIYDEETGKGPGGWYSALVKTPSHLTNEQLAVYRAVHAWRDRTARKDDDSTNTVMSNHIILSLARLMPTNLSALYGAVHPISHNVKSRTTELLEVIKAAKAAGASGPSLMDVLRPDSAVNVARANDSASNSISNGRSKTSLSLLPNLSNNGALRSEVSTFWGRAFGSSVWEPPAAISQGGEGLRLAVPLPPLSSDIFAHANDGVADLSKVPDTNAQDLEDQAIAHEKVEEEAFIVKSGRKRKSEAMTAEEDTGKVPERGGQEGQYDISLNDEEEQKAREKAARKAERKAQKKIEKARRKAGNGNAVVSSEGDAQAEDEEAVFDYSKAPSVLHSKGTKDTRGPKGKKAFDPYTKSADAPKGMRRLQTERPGKSFTFKS